MQVPSIGMLKVQLEDSEDQQVQCRSGNMELVSRLCRQCFAFQRLKSPTPQIQHHLIHAVLNCRVVVATAMACKKWQCTTWRGAPSETNAVWVSWPRPSRPPIWSQAHLWTAGSSGHWWRLSPCYWLGLALSVWRWDDHQVGEDSRWSAKDRKLASKWPENRWKPRWLVISDCGESPQWSSNPGQKSEEMFFGSRRYGKASEREATASPRESAVTCANGICSTWSRSSSMKWAGLSWIVEGSGATGGAEGVLFCFLSFFFFFFFFCIEIWAPCFDAALESIKSIKSDLRTYWKLLPGLLVKALRACQGLAIDGAPSFLMAAGHFLLHSQ